MSSLTGDQFDLQFLISMTPHHGEAIVPSKPIVEHAVHQQLRDLAEKIVQAQAQQVEQQVNWLCQGYIYCVGAQPLTEPGTPAEPYNEP